MAKFLFFSFGIVVGVISTLTAQFLPSDGNSSRQIKDAINDAKIGKESKARSVLERNMGELNASELSVLADLYALGRGGPVEEQRAAIIARVLACSNRELGSIEYWYAKQSRHDKRRAVRWLIRAADAGHGEASSMIGSTDRMRAAGFDPGIIHFGGWEEVYIEIDKSAPWKNLRCRIR